MKKLSLVLVILPLFLFANDLQVPSKIKEVTVYLSGAQITRSALCTLKAGTNEVIFSGLSAKIEEHSIQVSGLQAVSILSMSYDIDYLAKTESYPEVVKWESRIDALQSKIAFLKNRINGLEEEEKVISANRLLSSETQALDLEKIKEISTYYRQRITAIKDEIFTTHKEIEDLTEELQQLELQLIEVNRAPEKKQGKLSIRFDAPAAINLELSLTYTVKDAGWIPSYDIKSERMNDPLNLTYKALVYQKTGSEWKNVKVTLSTGNPNLNVEKPDLGTHYLNFVSNYQKRYGNPTVKKHKYAFNPTVKRVLGTVTDASGAPLPGCSVVIKGTTIGTQTDFDGNYALDIKEGQTLSFSYVGFATEELPIYASLMNVRLQQDAAALEEVVVTAYGLAGAASGVSVRGHSSTPKPVLPLYIIDGVPVDGFAEGDLDESEVLSIKVLKEASATSIYGSRGANGIILITTRKSSQKEGVTSTEFVIKKPHSIISDGDITAIEINTYRFDATYEYFAAPIINENVFLTASCTDWETYNLLPGEANIYFDGGYAGKTTIDPYTSKKEMSVSLGMDPQIIVVRKQNKNFKSNAFIGSNRILDRTYELEVKNNKSAPIRLKLMDRIPQSQNKEIKVSEIETHNADYDKKKGLLTWKLALDGKENKKEGFSFKVKYPRYRSISL